MDHLGRERGYGAKRHGDFLTGRSLTKAPSKLEHSHVARSYPIKIVRKKDSFLGDTTVRNLGVRNHAQRRGLR